MSFIKSKLKKLLGRDLLWKIITELETDNKKLSEKVERLSVISEEREKEFLLKMDFLLENMKKNNKEIVEELSTNNAETKNYILEELSKGNSETRKYVSEELSKKNEKFSEKVERLSTISEEREKEFLLKMDFLLENMKKNNKEIVEELSTNDAETKNYILEELSKGNSETKKYVSEKLESLQKQIDDLKHNGEEVLDEAKNSLNCYKSVERTTGEILKKLVPTKRWWGLIDSIDGSFGKYFLEHNMPEKIELFKKNLDEYSKKVAERTMARMVALPDESVALYCNLDVDAFRLKYDDELDKCYDEFQKKECGAIKTKYKLSKPSYDMEVFLYHHGLKNANQKIKDYLKDKDFIDGGAYIGDSALVMFEYSPKCVHSFEISPLHIENYLETMKINNIDINLYKINKMGLADSEDDVRVNGTGASLEMGMKIYNGQGESVKIIPLDKYVFENSLNVGFIKADIEGAMFRAMKGMVETIKKFRPVLSLAIYHSGEEFFDTKILLDEITADLNYSIHIDSHYSESMHIYGTILWAYPKELEE